MNATLAERLGHLSTPHLTDACLRIRVPVRCAPAGLRPITPDMRCAGRARPARHVGSVDIFLEALERATPGEVLVVDNAGRLDEACVGDLVTLEVKIAGLAGIVVWGLHRDTTELVEIGLPFFSLGAVSTGPLRLDWRPPDSLDHVIVGAWIVTPDDVVIADADGVIFVSNDRLAEVVDASEMVRATERRQADEMRRGRSLRELVSFKQYLARRAVDREYGFREHLRSVGGAVEE
jgi:4-hydroxy-4-methyl-2-oxoglutarate aldolase